MTGIIAQVLLVVLALSTANALIWLYRERRAWRAIKPYSFTTRLSLTLPFSRRWESRVPAADLEQVARLRRGFLFHYYLLWVVPIFSLLILMTCLSYVEYLGAKRDFKESERQLQELRQQVEGRSSSQSP